MIRKLRLNARQKPLAVGTLLAAALFAACQPAPNTAEVPAGARATLHACASDEGPSDAKCASVEVFENRSAAEGRKIELHVVVLPAFSRTPAADPLFILAGGPGQAATELVNAIKAMFRKVQAERDIVLVDQRGTGKSNPLDCSLGEYGLEALSRVEFPTAELRQCLATLDADPRLYTTPIAMDDLDDVRAALGYNEINVWGGSYGTRAALVYLRQHRDRVRSVVLDGAAPVNMTLPLHVPEDGQRALDLLLSDCEADPHCSQTFPNLRGDFQSLLARLDNRPERVRVKHPRTGSIHDIVLRRDVVAGILFGALYSPLTSSLVPLMIDRANQGDFQSLITLAAAREDIADSMSYGMFLSVICAEDIPQSSAQPPAAAGGFFLRDVMRNAWGKACEVWPRGELPEGYHQPVESDAPVLVLSGQLDPITPPHWGDEVGKHLSNSRHIVVPGVGHGATPAGCVPHLLEQFIAEPGPAALDDACVNNLKRPPFFVSNAGPLPPAKTTPASNPPASNPPEPK